MFFDTTLPNCGGSSLEVFAGEAGLVLGFWWQSAQRIVPEGLAAFEPLRTSLPPPSALPLPGVSWG